MPPPITATSLDLLFGWYSHWDDRNHIDDGAYAHATYLVTPLVTTGNSVIVPLRVGIGVALFDDAGRFDQDLHVALRVPLETPRTRSPRTSRRCVRAQPRIPRLAPAPP